MKLRLTPALLRFLADQPDEGTRQAVGRAFEEALDALVAQPAGADRARDLHRRVEEGIAAFFDRRPALRHAVRCAKGCAHCCRVWVGVTRDEAALLAASLRTGAGAVDRERLRLQAAWSREDYEHAPWEAARCPLLAIDGTCSVYAVRPAACRTMLVTSDPERCQEAGAGTGVTAVINPYAEIPRSAALSLEAEDLSLALGLWEALEGAPE